MKILRHIVILVAVLATTASEAKADRILIGGMDGLDPEDRRRHHSVLMAMSGGGIRGLAAIGVLKAFEEKGLRVAGIAGTSMGGIVGGLYAAGYGPGELEVIAARLDYAVLFQNAPPRSTMLQTRRRERGRDLLSIRFDGFVPIIPQGLTSGQRLSTFLTQLTVRATYQSAGNFRNLPIPFATVSTDVVSGERYVFTEGSLADAMRATMAFPLAFTGLAMDGRLLMDGGMVSPVPVDVARGLSDSVDFVVAVNTASPLLAKEDLVTPVDIANQVTSIMTADKLEASLREADYVIAPAGDDISSTDFRQSDVLIEQGYRAGLTAADSIIAMLDQRAANITYSVGALDLAKPLEPERTKLETALIGWQGTHHALVDVLKDLAREEGYFRLEAVARPDTSADGLVSHELSLSGFPYLHGSEVSFRFIGSRVFDDSTLLRVLALGDSVITPSVLKSGLERIRRLYHRERFDLVHIGDVVIEPDSGLLTLLVDEGIIWGIEVENAERTRPWYIRAHFPLSTGEPFSTTRALEGIANIYGTDLFDRVTMDLVPRDGQAIVVLRVVEKKYRQVRFGWHWDDEYESEEFVEVVDDNVAGIGLEIMGHARYSPDRQHYFAGLKVDRIFKTYLTGRMRLYHSMLDRHIYDTNDSLIAKRGENTTGFELRLGQQIARLGTVSAGLIVEEVQYDFEYEDPPREERFGLRALSLESLVETFDRMPFPQSGKKHYFELRQTGKVLGGEVEYTRFFTSLEGYFPLGAYLNYHPKVSLGISRSGLPWSEKFYLGGMNSFAGFRTHQLAGDKMFLMSHELRGRLPLHLYLSVRYDLGDVYEGADEIKLGSLRHGFGVFLALDTPLGPFEVGYGAADDDFERWYLRAGFRF